MWCGHTAQTTERKDKTMRTFTIENDNNNITITLPPERPKPS